MYVNVEEIAASPAVQITAAKIMDDDLETLIEHASRYFDILCGVRPGYFEPNDGTASARTFYGDGTNYLALDPYVAGSLDSTIVLPEGYTAPTFVERDGYLVRADQNGLLIDRLFDSGWLTHVPVTVTAKWGFDDDSGAIKGAVIELVINLVRTLDPAETNLTDLEGQPLREKAPPRVLRVAQNYKRRGRAFIV